MRLLVVEDDPGFARALVRRLRGEGHMTELAMTRDDAIAALGVGSYDAIILDLLLANGDGFAVLDRLRGGGRSTPVIALTAKNGVEGCVTGLDRGADDHLVKPFQFEELFARVRALVRRSISPGSTSILRVGDLEIDTARKRVVRAGRVIALSVREFAILECLALRKDRVVTRETLLDHVYENDALPESNVLEVYIGTLRRKIDRGHATKLIHTQRGVGYLLAWPRRE